MFALLYVRVGIYINYVRPVIFNIEVDNRCVKSNLLTDSLLLLYTGVGREVFLYYLSGTCGKKNYYELEVHYQLLPGFIKLKLTLKVGDLRR